MANRDVARNSGAVSVLITDTAVVADNPSREELTLVNDGANVVYLQFPKAPGLTTAAIANNGLRLNASGGSWTTQTYTGPVRAIAVGGTSVVTVAEF